jgi:signal transduction histidine kinase/ligand-binding sensor domain-containing protein/AraC-like DNA-binding protein
MRGFVTIIILLFLHLTYGQSVSSLKIKKLSTFQGLSSSIVSSIAQDNYGFMWFATEDGLNKYDGYKFTVYKYNYNDPNSLADNFVSDIKNFNESNQLWIATNNGLDLFDYNNERFIHFTSKVNDTTSLINNLVTKIAKANDGNLWIGTYGGGISHFNIRTHIFKRILNVPGSLGNFNDNKVMALLEDSYGIVWVGSQDAGLDAYDTRKNKVIHYGKGPKGNSSLPSDIINVIFEDRDHNVWIGTNNGLSFFKRSANQFITFNHIPINPHSISSNIVKTIMQDHRGVFWVGTQSGGLSRFQLNEDMIVSPKNASFDNIYESDDETGLSYSTVYSSFEDRDHNLWIGTYSGGINFISNTPDRFMKLQQRKQLINGLSYHKVWGICDDKEGNIWIGTDGGGINKFNTTSGITEVYRHSETDSRSVSDNAILCALKDHTDNLWFGTYSGGLNRYDPRTGKFIRFQHHTEDSASLSSNDVRVIYEDTQNNLWIGTNGGGLSLFLPSKNKFKNFDLPKLGILGNSVRAIMQDKDGGYWIGTYGNGLHYLSQGFTKILHFNHKPGDISSLGHRTVFSIIQDQKGRIWIGTEGGGLSLYLPESGKFRNYDEKNGLANNIVRAILEDHSGNLWLSTNNGISCFSPQKEYFNNYDIQDGLPPGEFSDGSSLFARGTMYFGNMNGLCYFSPEAVEKKVSQPKVHIVGLQLFNKNVKIRSGDFQDSPLLHSIIETNEIDLNYKQSVFTIEFSALHYIAPEKIQYAYMMEGLENEWNYSGNQRTANYRNLKPGHYTFKVKATNVKTVWGDSYTSFFINVQPPFWKTWWAYLIYVVVISSLIYLIFRYYTYEELLKRNLVLEKITRQKEQQLNQEKIRFFTNITHEFRSPLTLIIGPLEDLLRERNLAAPIGRKLLIIYRNSHRLLDLIDKLLEFRKVETGAMKLKIAKGNVVNTLKEICFPFREIFAEKSIEFTLISPINEIELWYDAEKLFIIINNLLSNAHKYTPEKGKVTLEISYDPVRGEAVFIKVKDTGVGIPQIHQTNIFDQYYRIEGIKGVKGSGIGLALTKNLVELHKGEITVESEESKGSCFTLKFLCGTSHFTPDQISSQEVESVLKKPALISENSQGEPSEATTDITMPGNEEQKKIMLIVEDNDEISHYIRDSFIHEFKILEAANGEEGLELSTRHLPDIIITDIMMPGIDGLELCKRIKTNLKTSHIPVIMLTARNALQQKQEGYETGADSYITKPFNTALLMSRVQNLLESRKRLAEHISRSLLFQPDEVHLGLKDEKFISDAIAIIEKHIINEKFDAEFLATELNLSHSALYRKLKALTGFNITEFVRGIRLKKAAQFLRSKDYTVSEVAYMVGFNDIKHFRNSFRDQYKVSPSDYMKSESFPSGEN